MLHHIDVIYLTHLLFTEFKLFLHFTVLNNTMVNILRKISWDSSLFSYEKLSECVQVESCQSLRLFYILNLVYVLVWPVDHHRSLLSALFLYLLEYARIHERLGISPKVPLSLPLSVQGRFIPPLTSRGSIPIPQPTQCPTPRASAFLASVRDRSCLESYYLEL